jgi:hypothetical protein
MSLVISTSDGVTDTFADAIAKYLETENVYWLKCKVQNAVYAVQEIAANGVHGVALKRQGFRSRPIIILVEYVSTTEYGPLDFFNSDLDDFENTECSILTPSGETYPACELISADPGEWPVKTGFSTYSLPATFVFEQKRLS